MADREGYTILAAEELAKEFREHSVAEFFKKNKQMLGLYGKVRSLTTVVHEYVTNSLDACEEARILPEIEVRIVELGPEYYEVSVKDNGPGMTKETVGKALGKLLAGTKFHRRMQMRGQQGIGAAGCTMFAQMTTGKPVKVITGTGNGTVISCYISIDPKLNEPKIYELKEIKRNFRGTAIQAKFKGVTYVESDKGPLEYLRRTAIANPHAKITFYSPKGEKIVFKRSVAYLPKPPKEVKPHPIGLTVDDILTLGKLTKAKKVSSFLLNELDRFGAHALKKTQELVSFDLNKDPKKLTWQEAEELVNAFKKIDFIAPSTDGLRPIGEERIKKSLENIVEPEFIYTITRKPKVYAGGFPFQVEIGIAYGGNAGRKVGEEVRMEIMRFANRAPLLFDNGECAITKAVQSIDWKRYGVKDLNNVPLTIFVNFISVYVPYTSAGKQAIADEDEILEELRLALMTCGRKTSHFISAKMREYERRMKRDMFYKYIPEIAEALSKVTKVKKEKIQVSLERLVLEKLGLEKPSEVKDDAKGKEKKE
jgi:DNA topoisomerase-6 subunit B